jgi:hypothetical protein
MKGYTAPACLGKSASMSRLVVLIVVVVLILGGLFFLSTVPKKQPTQTIEVAVPQGNAH